MPSRAENQAQWNEHAWPEGGDEWSVGWGSARTLWHATILPRVHFLLPAPSLLEIAPGFGRVTAFLLPQCTRYVGVDLTAKCVEACRQRFRATAHARFEQNDGLSLACVESGSVDVALSWDSLVHADASVLSAYARELARVLVPGGRAFLHHSNLGAFAGREPPLLNPHWRDSGMSAELMRRFAAEAGLEVDGQELVQWGSPVASDAFTWLRKRAPGEAPGRGELRVHPSFPAEIEQAGWVQSGPGRGLA
jgi:SAM-dependent methyltransferase